MKTRIDEAESAVAQKLSQGIPFREALRQAHFSVPDENYTIRVLSRDSKGRKKPSHANVGNWSAESRDFIEIRFEPARHEPKTTLTEARESSLAEVSQSESGPANSDNPISDLIRALNRAESRPGWSFVPLKKFRDEILAAEQFPWVSSAIERRNVLQSAIDKKLLVVGHVQNPKPPHFPVSTVRLNRLLPEVQQILGSGRDADVDFHPVEIPTLREPLSATIIRERR